jgi:hypothetical protein
VNSHNAVLYLARCLYKKVFVCGAIVVGNDIELGLVSLCAFSLIKYLNMHTHTSRH